LNLILLIPLNHVKPSLVNVKLFKAKTRLLNSPGAVVISASVIVFSPTKNALPSNAI
jgi:hypothetical protein